MPYPGRIADSGSAQFRKRRCQDAVVRQRVVLMATGGGGERGRAHDEWNEELTDEHHTSETPACPLDLAGRVEYRNEGSVVGQKKEGGDRGGGVQLLGCFPQWHIVFRIRNTLVIYYSGHTGAIANMSEKSMYPPGLQLRRTREKLGLTYRDVEKSSYEIAVKRGRPEFVLHISRLADIENHNVVPSLHKLYSLATIYHISPLVITSWYEAPFQLAFHDGASFPTPRTHLREALLRSPQLLNFPEPFDKEKTGLLQDTPQCGEHFPSMTNAQPGRYRYGNIGLSDRRMVPILRPGSIVLVDTALQEIEDAEWTSEYDRPLYFVELRGGYRCGWFQKEKTRLIMQPHPLSRCAPEAWRMPEEAEVNGQVVGVVTYLNEPWTCAPGAMRAVRSDSRGKVL
jgi:transcriptional regulator with XRE-family HTH domain